MHQFTKKNNKPEKSVESQVLAWARCQGWDLDVVDSKAVFSKKLNCYTKNKGVPEGFTDLVGCTDLGRGVFVELKAIGVRKIRVKQRAFIMRKIAKGCIAGPVRSVAELLALSLMDKDQMLEWVKSFKVDFK